MEDRPSRTLDRVAVLAADDLLAIAVEKALRQAKRPSVPMVGFNNSTFSITATPELSSVDIRLANQCEIIVQNLLKETQNGVTKLSIATSSEKDTIKLIRFMMEDGISDVEVKGSALVSVA